MLQSNSLETITPIEKEKSNENNMLQENWQWH